MTEAKRERHELTHRNGQQVGDEAPNGQRWRNERNERRAAEGGRQRGGQRRDRGEASIRWWIARSAFCGTKRFEPCDDRPLQDHQPGGRGDRKQKRDVEHDQRIDHGGCEKREAERPGPIGTATKRARTERKGEHGCGAVGRSRSAGEVGVHPREHDAPTC